MKILFLVSSMYRGGAERVAATLCNAWASRGDEVTLVATYSGRGECQYPLAPGVRLVYLADRVNGRHKVLGYGSRLLALRRLVRKLAPDVAISFLTNVNITAAIATSGLGVPLILCERIDPLAATDNPPYTRAICRLLYPLADVVTVQTASIAAKMRDFVPRVRRIEVIANPIPEELLRAQPAVPAKQRRRLVTMGRLAAQKQLDHLVAAFASLAPAYPDLDLWIWGEGELRGSLEAQVRAAGLESRVRLPGRTDTPWPEMAAGDIFVLTSAYEGFPNVMLEAMALGVPCVTYDCPSGPRELSEDGRVAVLVPLNDRDRLRDSIAGLLDDVQARVRLGEAAAASVRQRYRLDSILADWDRLIHVARRNRLAFA